MMDAKRPPPVVDIVAPTYQPPKAGLEDDMWVRVTFEEAVYSVTCPVTARYIPRPKPHPSDGTSALSDILPHDFAQPDDAEISFPKMERQEIQP